MSARRYRYTGKERDEETGLYYHGARYYAPWLGRWTAADPSGVVDGVNLFQYVGGNPVALNDPLGRKKKVGWSFSGFVADVATGVIGGPAATLMQLHANGPSSGDEGRRELAAGADEALRQLPALAHPLGATIFDIATREAKPTNPQTTGEKALEIYNATAGSGGAAIVTAVDDYVAATAGTPEEKGRAKARIGVQLGMALLFSKVGGDQTSKTRGAGAAPSEGATTSPTSASSGASARGARSAGAGTAGGQGGVGGSPPAPRVALDTSILIDAAPTNALGRALPGAEAAIGNRVAIVSRAAAKEFLRGCKEVPSARRGRHS